MEWLNVRRSADINCARPSKYYKQAVLINISDINDFIIRRESDRHTVKFSLKPGASGSLFRANELSREFSGMFSEVREQGIPLYSHSITSPVIGIDQDSKILLKEIDNGKYFFALQNQKGVIEIYGFENGMHTEDYDYNGAEVNTIDFVSIGLETDPPLIYVSDGNSDDDFNNLFQDVTFDASQERYFISDSNVSLGIFSQTEEQTAWRPISGVCQRVDGKNTGLIIYGHLQLYDLHTGQGLITKVNTPNDPDYFPPEENTSVCPISLTISVTPSTVMLPSEGGLFSVEIQAEAGWDIYPKHPLGLTISETEGIGNATLEITSTSNSGDSSLDKSFRVVGENGDEVTVTVWQESSSDDAIADLQDRLSDLYEYLHTSFLEGVLDPVRLQDIESQLNNLQVEKAQIDSKFQVVYNNSYLNDIVRQVLVSEKQNFDSKHVALVTSIQDAISDGEVTEAELDQIQSLFLEYRSAIGQYTLSVENALEVIAANRIDAITIGTRNLLLYSKNAQFQSVGNFLRYQFSTGENRWDSDIITWADDIRWDAGKSNVSSELLEGDHVVSVDVVSDVSQAITLKLTDDLDASSERVWELEAGRKTRVYVHLKANWDNQTLDFSIEKHANNSTLEVSGLKLAQGNKSDSYSPAPEDVEKAIEKTREEVTEAYKNYADAEAERAELETKLWADGKLTALEKMLLADATAKANAARRYAEAQDTHLQILTEAYADGKIDTLEAELIDLSEANLTAAQGYIDAQILLEQVRSDGYVDEEIATERQRAIDDAQQKYDDAVAEAETLAGDARDAALQDAQNKYDAAISHANAEAALAQAESIAHADGIVTAEEAARIAALEDYEEAAQTYADAAQNLAEVNAAAYADGIVTAEEQERIDEAEANLLEAKQHATSLADAIDTRIDGQNDYIIQVAEDNLAAAKEYSELQDAALQTTIQSYADGIVTDAEARMIAEAQAEAQAAKDYAEAQDNLLDTAIRAYADGEITDAEARAIHEAELKVQAVRGEMETLRTDLEAEIDQVASRLDTLETDTLAAIEDGILTQTEISNLKTQKQLLDKEKTDVDRRYQITYASPHLEGGAKDNLADSEGIYQTAYTALSDYYNDIFATEEIPEGDPVALLDAYRTALADFSAAMDTALSAIAQKKADLAEGSAIFHTDTRLNEEVIPAINDVQAAADALEFITDESFWDGKLDENEAKALQLHLEPLETEKEDIYSKYAVVYTNDLLKDPARENLYLAYDTYDDAHEALVDAIESLAVGEITPAKRQTVTAAFSNHRNALKDLTTAFEEAAKAIEYEHIDGIIVGTRNLLLNSDNATFTRQSSDTLTYEVGAEEIRWNSSAITWDDPEVTWDSGAANVSTDKLVGQHAVGLDVIVPTQRNIRVEIRDTVEPFTVKAREHLVPAGQRVRIWAVGEGKEGNTGFVISIITPNVSQVEYSDLKLEIGNKATDHNPAPEDIYAQINTARENAQSAAEAYAKAEAERQALETKVWADGKITEVERKLLNHADAVANAARRYSEAEDQHLQILIESWADGEISDLEEELIQLSNDNLDAAERAATAAANASETAAKAYADGEISSIETSLMGYTDAAAAAAEGAAIAADAQLKGTMEAYTDGKVDAEEQARIDALAAAASAAEDYADAAEQAAIVAANNAADGKITAMEAALQSYADGAADAAKNAAIAADTALQGVLEAYADGKVSTEEANRIAALQAYADAAEGYADAAANAAQIAAESHADGEISDAEARAIADATQKMNDAKQLAQDLFDGLQDELDDVSANAQQAKEVAEELDENLDAFGTKVGNHSVITGAVGVTDSQEINAGISGVTDTGDQSVRFWAGANHPDRYSSPFKVLDDGTVITSKAIIESWTGNGLERTVDEGGVKKWYDAYGVLRKEQGWADGSPIDNLYDEGGIIFATWGDGGLRYINYVPESWSSGQFGFIVSNATWNQTTIVNAIKSHISTTLVEQGPPVEGEHWERWRMRLRSSTQRSYHKYFSGNNPNSYLNQQYEGYFLRTKQKTLNNNFIDNGWYTNDRDAYAYVGYSPFGNGYDDGSFSMDINVQQIIEGEEIDVRQITLSGRVSLGNGNITWD